MREILNVPRRFPPSLPYLLGAKPELLLSLLPPHFSRINLFRSGKVAVTTTPSRESRARGRRECRKRGEEKSQVIYSPPKEPPPQGERSGASILLPPIPPGQICPAREASLPAQMVKSGHLEVGWIHLWSKTEDNLNFCSFE